MKKVALLFTMILLVACQERSNEISEVNGHYALRVGEESRSEVLSNGALTSKVGILESEYDGFRGHCSASLVGADWVLTAAHCVYNRNYKGFAQKIRFSPDAYRNKEKQLYYYVEAVYYNPLYIEKDTNPVDGRVSLGNIPNDVVLLKLKDIEGQPKAGDVFGWFEMSPAIAAGKGAVIGYPGDKLHGTKWIEENCAVRSFADGVYDLDCDTAPGSSGSSILVKKAGVYHTTGVFSADGQGRNYAAKLEGAVYYAAKALVSNQFQNLFQRKNINTDIRSEVSLRNECDQDLYVALSYMSVNHEQQVTEGFSKLNPGETRYLAELKGQEIYIYSQTMDGSFKFTGEDASLMVQDMGPFGFVKHILSGPQRVVISLNCGL